MGEYTPKTGSSIDTAGYDATRPPGDTFEGLVCKSKDRRIQSTCKTHQKSETQEGSDAAQALRDRFLYNDREKEALVNCSGCFLRNITNINT